MILHHPIIFLDDEQNEKRNLPKELEPYIKQISSAVVRWTIKCNMQSLFALTNWQFQWLPPPVGWVGLFNRQDPYRSGAFESVDKFRGITMVKLNHKPSFFTPEKLKEVEERTKFCLPNECITPPSIHSDDGDGTHSPKFEGWGVSLEDRGCSIGIYTHKYEAGDGRIEDFCYVILHHALPLSFINQLQEKDKNTHLVCEQWLQGAGKEKKTPSPLSGNNVKPLTFEQNFASEQQWIELSQHFAQRLIYYWAGVNGIELDVKIWDGDGKKEWLDLPEIADSRINDTDLVTEAIKLWPRGALISPFSVFPSHPNKKLNRFPIGLAVSKFTKEQREVLRKSHELKYDPSIISFIPNAQTIYNYPSDPSLTTNLELKYYNNSTAIDSVDCFLHHRGLEAGFDCYNYNPITDAPFQKTRPFNDFANSFPVISPFSTSDSLPPPPADETVKKFFSREGGGLSSSTPPSQLRNGKYINTTLSQLEISKLLKLHPPLQPQKISLHPLHVFLSEGCTNTAEYKL